MRPGWGRAACAWAGWLAGVVGVLVALGPPALRAGPTEPGVEAQAGRCELWVDIMAGEPASYTDVLEDVAAVQVAYLGERHGVARHHQWQARIVEDLAKKGRLLVLALEQIEGHFQPAVDRYNRGEIDFAELARATNWAERWPGYEGYRPAIETAHRAGAPVLALNARQETIRQVARGGGVRKLGRTLRAELPGRIVLDDPVYERVLRLELGVHMAASPERLRPMVEAQIARDETMAERLADFLRSAKDEKRTAVVLAGSGHVAYGLGMPSRVRRRLRAVRDRILVFSESGDVELTPEMAHVSRPVEITHEDLRAIGRPFADYLEVAAERPAPVAEPQGR